MKMSRCIAGVYIMRICCCKVLVEEKHKRVRESSREFERELERERKHTDRRTPAHRVANTHPTTSMLVESSSTTYHVATDHFRSRSSMG
jgi:ribose 1,5-bisphosphokinase PhnN